MTIEHLSEFLTRWRGLASAVWLIILLGWETWAPSLQFFRTPRERVLHALPNLLTAWVNALATSIGFVLLWKWGSNWSANHGFGLLNWLPLPAWLHLVLSCLLLDAWTYLWHRLCHRAPWLWKFHRMHHSDPRMDVTTANRFHLVEILISSFLRMPVLVLGGIHFEHLVVYETLLQVVVQWQHANISLPPRLESLLNSILVTPGLHKVHHSRSQSETDSNYSALLSLWDRVFGSLRTRSDPRTVEIGLDGWDNASDQTVQGLWSTPWRK